MAADEPARTPFRAVVVDARGPAETEILSRGEHALRRWQRTGLEVAVIASRAGARALPDRESLTLVVDGTNGGPAHVEDVVRQFGEATLEMEAGPSDTLVLAHRETSVAAARALGFRRIVGVAPAGSFEPLLEAGAGSAVESLCGLRFPRTLPSALDCLEEIDRWRGRRTPAVFLDFDGTLAPIVPHPDEAALAPEMRAAVARLARRFPVAVISGRDRQDVTERMGIEGLYYAGSHGLDIAGHGHQFTPPEAVGEHIGRLHEVADELSRSVGQVSGVVLERKRFSVAVHTRQVDDGARAREVIREVEQVAAARGLVVRRGKQVRELLPAIDWHKGRALDWLRRDLGIDPSQSWLLYVGDDETDEDAFQALGPEGIGVRPGPRVASTLADYHVSDVEGVRRLLEWLAG